MPGTERVGLVTGATGTVGSRVAHRLVAEGYRVRVLVRRPGPFPEIPSEAEVIQGDLTDCGAIDRAMAGANLVVHAAAYIGFDWDIARAANIDGTRNMLNAAKVHKPDLFSYISTLSVYNVEGLTSIAEEAPLWLDSPHAYHQTKAQAETLVWAAMAEGLPAVILRSGAILSANDNSYWGPLAVKRIAQAQQIHVNPREALPWVHVENLVDMVLLTARATEARGQAYNALDGDVPSSQFQGRIAAWLDRATEETHDPVGFLQRYSTVKIRALGYRTRVAYEEAMEELRLACLNLGLIPG